ncbi:TIM barrel protein [Paraburkholderia sp. CNPSo 3157]|uniref:TIM barrel protein n=1 Tax=Paraburkholderia franconis TaxID=2654983 RepID=A0A7X1THS2_9BURK|nr:sugar phosphate isomerase/epimerase [Paraburkholderia franconis]MPW19631.1 TIM barrel protein [Paraburkholderia franconis]
MSTQSHQRRFALSPVTIAQCSFDEAFEQTARAGFTGIGLRYDQFERYLEQGGSVDDVKRLLAANGLRFAEAAFLAEWQYHGGLPLVSRRRRSGADDETSARLTKRLHAFLAHCEQFECANVTAVPALRETGDLDVAAEEFATLCDIAQPYGVRLCVEFMGTAPQICDLQSGADLVTRAGRKNGGLLIDTFLFHQGHSRIEHIARVPVEKIFNVQLADAKSRPRDQLDMLADRVFPGEGAANVRAVVDALVQHGYDGWWTVELFNPEYAKTDAKSIASHAFASAVALFDRSSLRVDTAGAAA